MALPALPWPFALWPGTRREALDHPCLGRGNLGMARGRDHEQALAGIQVEAVERAVLGVVQAHDERPDPGLHHGAHALEAGAQVGKRIAAPDGGLREPVHAELGRENDAERTLGADPQLVKRRTGGGARTRTRTRDRAVGKDDLEALDHALDASVPARLLARRARRDETADGRAGQGAR